MLYIVRSKYIIRNPIDIPNIPTSALPSKKRSCKVDFDLFCLEILFESCAIRKVPYPSIGTTMKITVISVTTNLKSENESNELPEPSKLPA